MNREEELRDEMVRSKMPLAIVNLVFRTGWAEMKLLDIATIGTLVNQVSNKMVVMSTTDHVSSLLSLQNLLLETLREEQYIPLRSVEEKIGLW